MGTIRDTFPSLFTGNGGYRRPIAGGYRAFTEKWGIQRIAYTLTNENIAMAEKVSGMFATSVLQYMSYLKDKNMAEEEEDKFQENLRKQKR